MKKLRSRIVTALVAVTALTCCFLGSTFAKYTSSATSEANATVAKWEVTNISDNTEKNNFTFTADKLSPSIKEGELVNTLSSEGLVITNSSDVSAEITVNTGDLTVAYVATPGTWNDTTMGMTQTAAESAVFEVSISADKTLTNNKITLAKGESVTLTVSITWTTQETNGDLIDTYFGMYATDLSAEVALTATQVTQTPAAA